MNSSCVLACPLQTTFKIHATFWSPLQHWRKTKSYFEAEWVWTEQTKKQKSETKMGQCIYNTHGPQDHHWKIFRKNGCQHHQYYWEEQVRSKRTSVVSWASSSEAPSDLISWDFPKHLNTTQGHPPSLQYLLQKSRSYGKAALSIIFRTNSSEATFKL